VNVIVDHKLTSYKLSGKGKLVLLIHGWGDNAATFKALQEDLSGKYTVLAVDLPGFGGSETPSKAWDLDNYALFLQALLKKLKLPEPYALIGHSNGGALVIRAISLGTLKPQKLVLIAAAGIRSGQKLKRLMLKTVAKIGNVATIWFPEGKRQALRKKLYGVAGSDMLVVPELKETFKKTVRQDVTLDAAKVKIDTLLIYAEDDHAVPLAIGRKYKQLITNSQLTVISGAGHFVHHDQEARVFQLVEEFIA
jgi:pimeloyl-ACP methyl ester carboxylesterase